MWDYRREELDSKGTQTWAHSRAFEKGTFEACQVSGKGVNMTFIDNNQKFQRTDCWYTQKEVGEDLTNQHEAELQEAGITDRLLAKDGEEGLYVSHKNNHRMWLLRVGPLELWIMSH